MSNEQNTKLVTPTGRILFLKNLFQPDAKGRYKASLLLSDKQDVAKIEKLMMDTANARFEEKVVKSKKFKWGMKRPDEDTREDYNFYQDDSLILNASTKFEVDVKGSPKGPDGKYEDLIESDLKAGDHCRFLISAYAWENTSEGTNRGVSLNLNAVQMIKEGEALYSVTPSDDIFAQATIDIEVEDKTESNAESSDDDMMDF